MTSRLEGGCMSSESDSESDPMNVSPTPTDQSRENNIFTHPAFTDPVFAHLSRTLSIRELVQLKAVSKQIAPLIPKNSFFTAQARSQNDSMDCYFPLYTARHLDPQPLLDASKKRKRARASWVWSGVHHLTEETHTLPSLQYLSPSIIKAEAANKFRRSLLPSSGSLLLFVLKAKKQKTDGTWNDKNLTHAVHKGWRAHWIPLLVTNPLTQEYKVLREPANANATSWDYEGARAHLVEDEYANTYRVLLVFRDSLYIYKSTTKCWNSWNFKEAIPWGVYGLPESDSDDRSYYYDVTCAISGGKLWYAELEVDGHLDPGESDMFEVEEYQEMVLTKGAVRVFEVDDERGTWKPAIRYALKNFIPMDLHSANIGGFGFTQGSFAIEMVECMGGIYVLIPAHLNVFMTVGEDIKRMYNLNNDALGHLINDALGELTYEDFGFLGIRFYVLQLKGDGLPFGQALMQLPHDKLGLINHYHKKWYAWYENESELFNPRWTQNHSYWYYCRGWGTVISIMFGHYFIRYDVLSGVSTTHVLANCMRDEPNVSYKPSFYIKP